MFHALSLLLFLLSQALGDPYSCQNDTFVLDSVDSAYHVNTTLVAGNQNCAWNFTIPSDYMAEININGSSLASGDKVQVSSTWSITNSQSLGIGVATSVTSLHVMWPPQYFQVFISTVQDTNLVLTLDIVLRTLAVADQQPAQTLLTAVNQQPHFVPFTDWKEDTSIVAKAQGGGKLVVAVETPELIPQNLWAIYTEYANIFIYEGSGTNLQFAGTLHSLITYLSSSTYHSMTDTLTLYRAMDGGSAMLIINDYENMKKLGQFETAWSPFNRPDQNYTESITLFVSQGLAALTVINQAGGSIYLQNVHIRGDDPCAQCFSPLKLLAGGIIQDYNMQGTLLGAYKDWDVSDNPNYPQYLPGIAVTFVLEKGSATIDFSVASTGDQEAVDGRNGFVMSNNYPFMSQDQNSETFVLNRADGNRFAFQYTIEQQNPNTDAYLNFSVKDISETNTFTVNLTTPATYNITALNMAMNIVGGKEASNGTFISYKIFRLAGITTSTAVTRGSTTPGKQPPSGSTATTNQGGPSTKGTTSTTQKGITPATPTTTTSAPSTSAFDIVILIAAGIILFLAVIIVTILCLRYHIRRGKLRKFWVTASGIFPMATKVDEWELGERQLEILENEELGRGAFGIVFEGRLFGNRPVDKFIPTKLRIAERRNQVAVKRLLPSADRQSRLDFSIEIKFMKKLGYHPHILGMIGCITVTDLPLIVLDFCENGDLLSWIRKHKYTKEELHSSQLLSIAWQISDGLCYLKSINLLHRDLAARNILLTKEMVAKISDFGLSREPEVADDSATYLPRFYISRGGRLPIKWMAPESLRDFQFSFKTDVWSFGVLLWEMFTFGDVPFAGILPSALLELLETGVRLSQKGIADLIYEVMTSCWEATPEKRETIEKIKGTLNEMLKTGNDYGYLMVSLLDEHEEIEGDLENITVGTGRS